MTKIGCISDIHSNFSALKIVLQFLEGKIDILLCAGDFVGYGPQPQECLDLLLDYPLPHYYCLGNHDLGVRHEYCKATSSNNCNTDRKTLQAFTVRPAAEVMFRRNAQEITEKHYQFLLNVPTKNIFQIDGKSFYMTHGTPSKLRNDNIGRYLPTPPIQPTRQTIDRAEQFKKTKDIDIIVVGHTHQRFIINRRKIFAWSHIGDRYSKKQVNYPKNFSFPRSRIIINPGAVGQPRDGDPSASFAIIDTRTSTIECYALQYSRTELYRLIKLKCDPSIQDSTFWEISF